MHPRITARVGLDRAGTVYMFATGVAVVGTAFGLIGATGATTAAGGPTRGALDSGVFLAATMLVTALAVPYAPRICARLGVRRAYALVQAVNALAYLVAGVALLVGAPTMTTLLAAVPFIGASTGASSVFRPLLSTAFMAAGSTARACALMAVANGAGWGVGGLAAGFLLSHVAFGWGLVVNALLTTALIVTVTRVAPAEEPVAPRNAARPWQGVWATLVADRRVRWTAALGASSTIFLAPVTALVVPIAQDLRQQPEVTGAGLLLAAFSLGELCTSRIVARLSERSEDLPAGAVAEVTGGVLLAGLGIVALVLTGRAELVAWLVIGVGFGACRFAARSLFIGSAAEAGPPAVAAANLAAATTVALLGAPVGVLLCSVGIDALSAAAAVLLGGVGAIAVGGSVLGVSRSFPDASGVCR